ncbi:ATP-binding protein [Azohydromonas australica]|uniref:ATP-binding protein n=1 Tax=Azohydromonas australica TaxID=364039 RepID=UPI000686DBE6|nr:ATP-binding protein [Azohydromonas australica]
MLSLLLSAVLATVVATLRTIQLGHQAQAELGVRALQQASGVSAAIDADLSRFGRALQTHARFIERQGLLRQPSLLRGFMNDMYAEPSYAWAGVTDDHGQVLAALDGRLVGVDVSQRDWWSAGKQRLHFGDVHEARLLATLLPALKSGEPWRFIDIAVPVQDGGRPAGVLAVHLSWPWLQERIRMFAGTAPARAGQLFITGRDGHQRLGPLGNAGDPMPLHHLALEAPEGWRVLAWPDGQRYVTAWAASHGHAPYPGFGWVTLVRLPLPQVDATSLGWVWGSAAFAVVVGTALAWVLSSLFLLPLRQFVARVRGIARGQDMPPPRLLPAEFVQIHEAVLELVAQLREKESALRDALDEVRGSFESVGRTMPGFLFTRVQRGAEARYSFFSDSAHQYLGVSRHELMADRSGVLWMHNVDEEDARHNGPLLARAVVDGTALTYTYRVRGGDGCWRTLQATMVPREGGTAAERIFDGFAIDITELVEARTQAQRANLSKDRFLATMSHELRTPLNGILGFAKLLEMRLERDDDRRFAAHIQQAGQNLLRILNDVLDFSKIEAGRLELERLPFQLENVVDACRGLFAPAAAAKGVRLEVLLPEVPMPTLLGDAPRLQQVLSNLLSNAVKFTAQGRVALAVTLLETASGVAEVDIKVSDTGIGLSDEQQGHLFKPFQQADASTARRYGGTGLGLWISRRLVQAMGGDITVDSTLGQGTTLQLCIPFPKAAAQSTAVAAAETAAPACHLRVLVVDDIAMNREVLCELLQQDGQLVEVVDNGLAAVKRVVAGGIDLVLMDVEMPDVDGLQAARRIRELPGPAGTTPIWAVTGAAFANDVARAQAAGMHGHLSKPVDVMALRAVLAAVDRDRRP